MRHLLFISVLLLGVSWAMAQSDQTPTTQSPANGDDTAAMPVAGGNTTVQGCLSSSDGNYTLTDKNGNMYQLTGDTAKLSEHVGHEIKVTGTGSSGSTPAGTTGAKQTLQVSSIKHIAKTCQSGGDMSH